MKGNKLGFSTSQSFEKKKSAINLTGLSSATLYTVYLLRALSTNLLQLVSTQKRSTHQKINCIIEQIAFSILLAILWEGYIITVFHKVKLYIYIYIYIDVIIYNIVLYVYTFPSDAFNRGSYTSEPNYKQNTILLSKIAHSLLLPCNELHTQVSSLDSFPSTN